jgi:DNA-binding XRE family transcriptional regulator
MKKLEFTTHKEVKKKLMKDPNFRREYENLSFEFEIIKALIRARAEKNMTQEKLAKKIGVAQSALARFESGRTNPTLSFIKKITQGLGLKLSVK